MKAKEGSRRGTLILVIEDDRPFREYLRDLLENKGYQVKTAGDASEGMKAFRECSPELVMTDLLIPGRAGKDLISEFKKIDSGARIIAMTGGGYFGRIDPPLKEAEAAGATVTLSKPFPADTLLEKIEYLMRMSPGQLQQNKSSGTTYPGGS